MVGMFLPSGEKLPRVDAMAYAWTGSSGQFQSWEVAGIVCWFSEGES